MPIDPDTSPPFFDLVAVGASAGGISALYAILGALPADFPVPIALVQHRAPTGPDLLSGVLGRRTPLTVKQADQSERMLPGTVYVAPPDQHLLVMSDGRCSLSEGPKVRYSRPAVDRLFETASSVFNERLLAVILTGADGDGADGAVYVQAHGGTVLVQDPATAHTPSMPFSVLRAGAADLVVPLEEIAAALSGLVRHGVFDASAHRTAEAARQAVDA